MTNLQTASKTCVPARRRSGASAAALRKLLARALDYVPTVVTLGLIALYYIQLSQMG